MWRTIFSVLIVFSFLVYDTASARRSDSKEAQKINEFSDKISRQGNELFLRLKDGTVISRKDSRPSAGYRDCDGKVAITYSFLDFVDPWFVIHEQYYEGGGADFINWETGKSIRLYGSVVLSPDKTHLIAFDYPGNDPCNVEIWKISRSGLAQEWQGSCHNSLEWLNTDTIEVREDGEDGNLKYLNHDGASWKFSTPSSFSKADEAVHNSHAAPDEHETDEEWAVGRDRIWDLLNAARAGDLQEVRRLIRNGSDINARDAEEATALWEAAARGQVDIARFLLENGADVNAENMYGWTVLNCAAWEGHLEVVKVLLDHGADVTVRNDYCQTPLESAEERGHTEIVELFKARSAKK